jgi:hypothetical protein
VGYSLGVLSGRIPKEYRPGLYLVEQWPDLAADYEWCTQMMSITAHARKGKQYKELVRFGKPVIVLVLDLISKGECGMNWQLVLHDLTGVNPAQSAQTKITPAIQATSVKEAAGLWLKWGQENNLIDTDQIEEDVHFDDIYPEAWARARERFKMDADASMKRHQAEKNILG